MASLGSLVIELAANTARLQSDMGKAVNIVSGATARITTVFRTLGVTAGAAGIGGLALKSIELGDNLNKAAIKAGIGGKAMAELAHAAKMSDVDLSSLSTSLKKMQVNLSEVATGAKGPTLALSALGLTLADLKGLSPDRQFELLADRISKLTDPADRARAATELFGKAGADLLPLFEQGASGIRKAREEANRLGVAFGADQIKRLADADDAIKRLSATWSSFATTLTAKVAPALSGILELLSGKSPGLDADPVRRRMNELRKEIADLESFDPQNVREGLRQRSIDRVAASLSKANAEYRRLRAVVAPGHDESKGSAPIGYQAANKEEKQSATDDLQEIAFTGRRLHSEWLADMEERTRTYAERTVAALEEKEASIRVLLRNRVIDEEEAAKRLAELHADFNNDELGEVEVTAKRIGETVKELSEFAKQAARNMQDSLAEFLFDPFDHGLKGMLKGFVDTIRKMVAEAAAADIFGAITGKGGGNLNAIFTGVASLFGGPRAAGGPVSGGKTYLVGEKGPELLTMGSSGSITPNHKLGGGVTVVQHNDFRGATSDVMKTLPSILAAHGQQTAQQALALFKSELSRGAIR